MKLYFSDGGSSFRDNSRVGYDTYSIDYQLEPYTDGRYCHICEIRDCFTAEEARAIAHSAACDAVNEGKDLSRGVKEAEERMLKRKGQVG